MLFAIQFLFRFLRGAALLGLFLERRPRRFVRRLVRVEVRAQIVDQSVMIVGVHDSSPLHDLVNFLYPSRSAEALLQGDARFVTLQA